MKALANIKTWLQRSTPLKPALLEGGSFEQLVAQRMRQHGLAEPAEYLMLLQGCTQEQERIIEGVAVQESWLFRYPASFEVLADHLGQLRSASDSGRGLRMVSVGCAAGEEPVSLAITALQAGWPADRVTIDALDFNERAIECARGGAYTTRALRPDRPAWADARFTIQGDELHISAEVMNTIRHHHTDALQAAELLGVQTTDVLFCRNVLIYLSDQARSTLVERCAASLLPGGLLFVGHAEQLHHSVIFESLGVPQAFAWRRVIAHPDQGSKPAAALISPPAGRSAARALRSAPPAARAVSPALQAARNPAPATRSLPKFDPPPVRLADARALADSGDLQAARESAEAVLAADGPTAETFELLGTIHLALGAADAARQCFRKAVYLEPQRETARLQLALLNKQKPDRSPGENSNSDQQLRR